jgi:hypothetical protein
VDSQITAGLIGLALVVISSIGMLIRAKINQIIRGINENTIITTEVRDASNGQLSSVLNQLAAERNLVTGLRMVVRERDDRLTYLVDRMPESQELLRDYSARHTAWSSEADILAAEQHLLSE